MSEQLYWNPNVEGLSKPELDQLELERLQEELLYVYTSSDFYKQKFDEADFKPDELCSLRDLENVPFTTKDDLRITWCQARGLVSGALRGPLGTGPFSYCGLLFHKVSRPFVAREQ